MTVSEFSSMASVRDNNHFSSIVELQDEDDDSGIDTDKLSYEIFSILETKFLFGYDHPVPVPVPRNGDPHARGKICLLSVDGGGCGLRSFHSGKTLSYLETALKNKSGNPHARIADYFDVAAGTGVGGIFTAMLFASDDHRRPIFHAKDTWKFLAEKFSAPAKRGGFLKRVLNRISGGSSSAGPEKAMKEAFKDKRTGRNLTLKDTLKPILIPCYDLSSTAPFLFSRAAAVETDRYDFNLWEVCLATSAQPGVLGPVRMKSVDGSTRCVGVDGGLAMSNPTAAALTHVLHNKQEFPFVRGVEDILVLSVGVGGKLLEGSFDFDRIKKWTAENWALPLALIYCDSSAELVDHAVAMSFGQSHSSNYVRIQGNGPRLEWGGSSVDMDVKTLMERADEMLKQKSVESVMFNGKRMGEQSNMEKLDWFAAQLVLEHRRRTCRIAPTVAFKQPAAPNREGFSLSLNTNRKNTTSSQSIINN